MARPEIIAHRGASRERPENTLPAFARAAELGADAVELDVHLSRDGQLVVHHDPVVPGPSGPTSIRSMTLGALRALPTPPPTLGEVIATIGGQLRIYCELKGLGTAAASVVALEPLGALAAVHSFDHRMVADANRLNPAVARGVLETSYHVDPVSSLRPVDARDLWQHETLIDEALIAAVHAAHGRVIAWTVNAPGRACELAAWGIDGLCTDDVAGIQAALSTPT
jgi:glycerophosphoryl diester phosphodiesterase